MILWGNRRIKIIGGDFKKGIVKISYANEKPFTIRTDELKADGGFSEVKQSIELANGGKANEGEKRKAI